jgi:hypothetical protein
MRPPTLFISYPQKNSNHPLFVRFIDDLMTRGQVSYHLTPQHPGQNTEDPSFAVSKVGIQTSDFFIYVLSSTSNDEKWAKSEPCLAYASQIFDEAKERIIVVNIHNVIPPKVLKSGIRIDLTADYESGFISLLNLIHSVGKQEELIQDDKWVAAYYPSDIISETRSRTIMSLLFDKIICHFPIASFSACGGGAGVSNLLLESDALVEAGIIEAREELLYSNIGIDLSWDDEFEQFYKLQITAMAMDICGVNTAVPVTDNLDWPIPAFMVRNIDLLRAARIQASALAIESLEIALPPIANISDEDILIAREELKDQLIPFRRAMLSLAPSVRGGIENEASLTDIYREAKYVVETQIGPPLNELRDRLERERGKFWRRLMIQGTGVLPKFILSWIARDPLSAVVEAVSSSKDLLLDATDHNNLMRSLRTQGGLGYLLSVAEHKAFKP